MGTINWSIFEERVLLCFTEKKDRMTHAVQELDRVGMEYLIHWNFPTPYDQWEMDRLPIIPFVLKHKGCYNVSKGHYSVIKTAYHLGVETLLIMEDDCRYLSNLGKLQKALQLIPSDWDVLMLDHALMRGRCEKVNDFWSLCDATNSCACYAMNRKAMSRYINMYESAVNNKYSNPILRNCDNWTNVKYLGRDIKLYCATPNIAIQCKCPDKSNCSVDNRDKHYKSLGISYSDYQAY